MNTSCTYLEHLRHSFRFDLLFTFVVILLSTIGVESRAADPLITGQLGNDWELGELLYEDNFDDADKWHVQIEDSSSTLVPEVNFENGEMDMYIPSRGATAWLKEKIEGPVVVVYDVVCPTETLSGDDIRASDVNTFLHAADSVVEDRIFDDTLYTGSFPTYSKMNGYYASTGGGNNTTTRMRRYPRQDLVGVDLSHLVMDDKDGQAEFLLTAGQKHSVQLVAADGNLQYAFDGQIVYEMSEGDTVTLENPEGDPTLVSYDFSDYPEYTSGYFGFRMVRSHHVYSGLKIYRLAQIERTEVAISSLSELRTVVTQSDQHIILAPGDYNIEDLAASSRNFACSGSNNIIDLTGVYIEFPVGSGSKGQEHFLITGSNNTIQGGVFENTYANGMEEVTDFVAYNQNRTSLASGEGPHIVVQGDRNSVVGIKMTVRGSFPYGYGSIYGIGSSNRFGLDKRAGIAVQGTNAIIDSCELQMKAFGHGIYIQSPSNNTVVKNTLVEGVVRSGADMLADDVAGSLPSLSNFLDYSADFDNPEPIDPNEVHSLCEDGIRVYSGGGSVIVENCTVEKMRGGIRLYLASDATVRDSIAIDNGETNWNMPNNGVVINSSGNFSNSPLSDFRLSRGNMDLDWTIIPSPEAVGSHNLCDVLGSGHTIVFHQGEGEVGESLRPIVVTGSNSVIRNETVYPVILEASASRNTIISVGPVTDNGTDNSICTDIEECGDVSCGGDDPFSRVEAEDSCGNLGIQVEETGDVDGGLNVGWIDGGDWLKFDGIDFGRGAVALDARVASRNAGGDIEIRLGSETGQLVGTATVVTTGGWQNWETVSVDLDEEIEGVHDLYLVFMGEGASLLNINWFTFTKSADNVNLALDGAATQSSTDFEGVVERAIDGNRSGLWEDSSVTHTASEVNPWWEVDLGAVQSIGDIDVYPRTDECCTARFSLFTVSVLDADRNEVFSKSYTNEQKTALVVATRGVDGQIIRVQLDDENPLSLAEVEVYPYIDTDSDEDGMLDSVDPDDDNDGYLDEDDVFPTDASEWADIDGDAIGDNSDTDNDNDGVDDVSDPFPLDPAEWVDTDLDGIGDNADSDDDGDGVDDVDDLYPLDAGEWADTDEDGIGDNSEVTGSFINISTRAYVTNGNGVAIGGIVIEGSDPMFVLIQGVGSELDDGSLETNEVLMDTEIMLYEGDVELFSNDDWDSDAVEGAAISDAQVVAGAFTLGIGSKSSAILSELDPGVYTVILRGKDGAEGIALIEVYNVSTKIE